MPFSPHGLSRLRTSRPTHPSRGKRLGGVLAALTAGAVGLAAFVAAPTASAATSTLGQLAAGHGRYFGTALDNNHLSDSSYTSLVGSEFNAITPENSMKWDTIEPSQGQFNFSSGDAIVSFAQQHNEIVRGHNLVWHSQLPSWVSNLPTSQVQAAMENHITKEATHYKGEVYAWDVVNEPFNDDGTYRTDAFYNAMGSGYIADALKTAHAADPNAKLYLNDYNIEGTGAKADAMYNLVSSLKSQGVPIDGVGFETHLDIQYGFPTSMQQNMQRFANLGLDVAVTELDVRLTLPRDSSKDATQATYYSNVTNACLAVSRCVGITTWEPTDKYSWVPDTFSGEGAACLYDDNLQTKPDYTAVYNDLAAGQSGDTTPPSAPSGLTVSGTTSSSVSLSWSPATDAVGVTGYDVYRGSTLAGSTTTTTFTDSGLTPSTAYTYTVKAKDAAGNVSAASTAATATTQAGSGTGDTTPPSAPTNLAVSGTTSSSVSLTWTAATDNVGVTGYDVYRGSTLAGSSTSTSFTDSGLTAATAYTYTVKAKDAAGNVSAASTAATATTQAGSGTGSTGTLKVQYKNNDTAPGDNQIKPGLQLANTGTSAVSLSTVTVRYWFTGDTGASTYSTYIDYAALGSSNVTTKVASTTARTGADHYLEVGFTSGAGSLAAGKNTGDIQTRLNKTDWSNFNEANDYSYGTNTSYADAPKITVYVNGTLVYGTEPS
ncbi:endo-1,4-beta-xylanase [Actinacidiphila yeochonensis]|uniref:endo-1,4-beta-xylanase n=1 Tax=Actinacidiphila yeochonensis TaxID=89050 RepID=UPI00068DAF4E|nr:endo-1,4-beta-xylanase [Actinacidiphila yeochonensis]